MIPIYFRYSYKSYPFSPNATMRSKRLGMFTCGAICFVYGTFWAMIVYGVLNGIGIGSEASIILALISLIGMVVLRNRIKRNCAAKIEQQAMAELLALQHTDPTAFAQYAVMFAEELARYQAPYQYQAPAAPVQQPKAGFDIQMEQPEPVPEEPVATEDPEQPAQIESRQEQFISTEEPAVPEKKFCGQCGTKLKSGSLFCHNCGSKL